MKKYLELFRITHYMKNILIFIPLVFSKNLLDINKLLFTIYMIIPFCLVSSIIYIINDINDLEKDKKHPQKCKRPIASGAISISASRKIIFLLSIVACSMLIIPGIHLNLKIKPIILILMYFFLNYGYSSGLKNIPIIDILILASGYLIRVYYGGCIIGVDVSPWLYLTVLTGALYLGMGKRRNEFKISDSKDVRQVLQKYNYDFLDKNMYICITLAITFYALWSVQTGHNAVVWTVPLIIIILMRYSLDIENDTLEGDPMRVLLSDHPLQLLIMLYIIVILIIIYAV